MHRFILGLFVALFSASVFAFAPSPTTTSGNRTTFNPAPVAKTTGVTFGTNANGDIFTGYSGQQRMPVPGGGSIPVDVTGRIPKPAAAAAFGRFLGRALPVFSTGMAAYQFAQEMGWTYRDGSLWKITEGSPGPQLQFQAATNQSYSSWLSSREAAFADAIAKGNTALAANYGCPPSSGQSIGVVRLSATSSANLTYSQTTNHCSMNNDNVWALNGYTTVYNYTADLYTRTTVVTVPTEYPITVEQAIDEILTRDGWPTTSKFADAVKEAIDSGETVQAEPTAVTGPATSPNTVTQKAGAQPNTTATETKTNNHTYTGNTINTSIVTTVVTTNNTTGEILDTTTTTEEPAAEETPFEMPCGLAGLPPCNVKVDETGVPQTGDYSKADTALTDGAKSVTDAMTSQTQKTDLGGRQWSFLFPSGSCQPIAMGWSIWHFNLDMCAFPMIGLFRSLWAWAFGVMGALYIWRSASSAVGN
jgi:hypothetical protein